MRIHCSSADYSLAHIYYGALCVLSSYYWVTLWTLRWSLHSYIWYIYFTGWRQRVSESSHVQLVYITVRGPPACYTVYWGRNARAAAACPVIHGVYTVVNGALRPWASRPIRVAAPTGSARASADLHVLTRVIDLIAVRVNTAVSLAPAIQLPRNVTNHRDHWSLNHCQIHVPLTLSIELNSFTVTHVIFMTRCSVNAAHQSMSCLLNNII
jgi:hypothetical protein